jgi:protein phosphatase
LAAKNFLYVSSDDQPRQVPMNVRPGIEVSAQSDIGCQRENNEDSFGYWEPEDDADFGRQGRLAIVADGMGGYEGGQEASRLAVSTVINVYCDYKGDDPQAALIEALHAAHAQIRNYAIEHPHLHGMGTTCTAIAIVDKQLYYGHVGDTRLYLVRGEQLMQVTRDHSYVSRLVEAGVISREEAEIHPHRNILTSAMGTSIDLVMDSPGRPEQLQPGDTLILCSDGLWGPVHDPEILQSVQGKAPEQAAHALIQFARDRGGPDNITVQILRLA